MKQHIPRRTVGTNPFNKDRFKGNNEVIQDWDLDTKIYVWEAETLQKLRLSGGTEQEYRDAYNKIDEQGYIEVRLVPYDTPTMDAQILSRAGDTNNIQFQDNISLISNKPFDETFAKRFYSFENIPATSDDTPITVPIYLETGVTEVINNDTTLKQTTYVLERVLTESGIGESNFRSISFLRKQYSDIALLEKTAYVDITFPGQNLVALGAIEVEDITGTGIAKEIDFENYNSNWGSASETNTYAPFTIKPAAMRCDDNGICTIDRTQRYSGSSCWEPHLVHTRTQGDQVWFDAPWVWEYWYAWEQVKGQHYWRWGDNDGVTDQAYLDTTGGGNTQGGKISWDDYRNRPEDQDVYAPLGDWTKRGIVTLTGMKNEEIGGNAFEMEAFYNLYANEAHLPYDISSHGIGLDGTESNEFSQALFGAFVTKKVEGGTGVRTGDSVGIWRKHSSIFLVDFISYIAPWWTNQVDFYLSAPTYGSFLSSAAYGTLIDNVVNGVPNYNGSLLSSELGIHTDITDGEDNVDIKKMKAADCKMVLMPLSVTQLAGSSYNNEFRNPEFKHTTMGDYKLSGATYMESLPILAPKEPQTRFGGLDFAADSMIANVVSSFTNIPVDSDYFYDKEITLGTDEINMHMLTKLNTPQMAAVIAVNSYGGKEVNLRWFSQNEDGTYSVTKEVTVQSELAAGRPLSGGFRYIIM